MEEPAAPAEEDAAQRLRLSHDQRRVLGVLIEKSLTTPQYYPLTLNAIVAGCNQKSNRDPLVSYVEEEVEEILQELRTAGFSTLIYPAGSRTERWRQEFTGRLELTGQEMAVVAELLLRGTQTLGGLRTRAGRMKPIPDQESLERVLNVLMTREPALVVRLTPPGVKRGVRVTHNLYLDEEWPEIRDAEESGTAPVSPRQGTGSLGGEVRDLAEKVALLEQRIEQLEARLGE